MEKIGISPDNKSMSNSRRESRAGKKGKRIPHQEGQKNPSPKKDLEILTQDAKKRHTCGWEQAPISTHLYSIAILNL